MLVSQVWFHHTRGGMEYRGWYYPVEWVFVYTRKQDRGAMSGIRPSVVVGRSLLGAKGVDKYESVGLHHVCVGQSRTRIYPIRWVWSSVEPQVPLVNPYLENRGRWGWYNSPTEDSVREPVSEVRYWLSVPSQDPSTVVPLVGTTHTHVTFGSPEKVVCGNVTRTFPVLFRPSPVVDGPPVRRDPRHFFCWRLGSRSVSCRPPTRPYCTWLWRLTCSGDRLPWGRTERHPKRERRDWVLWEFLDYRPWPWIRSSVNLQVFQMSAFSFVLGSFASFTCFYVKTKEWSIYLSEHYTIWHVESSFHTQYRWGDRTNHLHPVLR